MSSIASCQRSNNISISFSFIIRGGQKATRFCINGRSSRPRRRQQGLLALRTNRHCCLAGATQFLFEPLDFMYRMYGMTRAQGCALAAIARLVALVPKPRVNLTRFHGVFAPHSKYRARVTPARRGKGKKIQTPEKTPEQTPAERRVSMTGFCSCKTGIHAIRGNNLGKAIETGI